MTIKARFEKISGLTQKVAMSETYKKLWMTSLVLNLTQPILLGLRTLNKTEYKNYTHLLV